MSVKKGTKTGNFNALEIGTSFEEGVLTNEKPAINNRADSVAK